MKKKVFESIITALINERIDDLYGKGVCSNFKKLRGKVLSYRNMSFGIDDLRAVQSAFEDFSRSKWTRRAFWLSIGERDTGRNTDCNDMNRYWAILSFKEYVLKNKYYKDLDKGVYTC